MNDLILSKMREGDWGEVVRLMRAEYGSSPDPAPTAPKDAPQEMPFRERFETIQVTPQNVADAVIEGSHGQDEQEEEAADKDAE